jgi:F0F1-type ATP synthase assembly protein I
MRATIPQHKKPNLLMRRALLVQWVLVWTAVLVVYAAFGRATAQPVMGGGLIAISGSALLWLRWWQSNKRMQADAQQAVRAVYRTGLERFVLVVLLLALGLSYFKHAAAALLAGFVLGQLAWLIGISISGASKIKD